MEGMEHATIFVPIAFLAWIPFVLALFAVLPPRRAALAALFIGWLFLPMASYKFARIPPIDKANLLGVSLLMGMAVFDQRRLMALRPRWYDVPMALVCLAPMVSSLYNGLGAHDGLTAVVVKILSWGAPYLVGRMYCASPRGAREAAVALFAAGVVYAPFCLYEIRMSPVLHSMLYGYNQHEFIETIRMGGYRPMVFMEHGLMVAMFMTSATLAGVWLWYTQALTRVRGVPVLVPLGLLAATTLLLKSTGALALLGIGLLTLALVRFKRSHLPLLLLIPIPLAYVVLRAFLGWDGQELVSLSRSIAGPNRAESLQFRIDNERLLVAHAMEQPLFGWGGWSNGFRPKDSEGHMVITDSLWIIILGQNGLFGLAAVLVAFLLPAARVAVRTPAGATLGASATPTGAGPVLLAVILTLWMMDCLFNAMIGPAYLMFAGGLAGLPSVVRHPVGRHPVATRQPSSRANRNPARPDRHGPFPSVSENMPRNILEIPAVFKRRERRLE